MQGIPLNMETAVNRNVHEVCDRHILKEIVILFSLHKWKKNSLTKVLREKQQNENNTQFHNYSQLHMN